MVDQRRGSTWSDIQGSRMCTGQVRRVAPAEDVKSVNSWEETRDWLAVILPPTTLVTALVFWFGFSFTNARVHELGIDASVLELSTTDYLVRSADPVIAPAAVVLTLLLGSVGLHALIRPLIHSYPRRRMLRSGCLLLFIAGSLGLLVGIRLMFISIPGLHYLVPPALLGAGAACAGYGFFTLRTMGHLSKQHENEYRTIPSWEKGGYVIVVLLVTLGLFWGTTAYAEALGRGRALTTERGLQTLTSVTIFSKQSLALADPNLGVLETRIVTPESIYKFQYSGLRLALRSSDKYFLFPEKWTRVAGRAIVLPDSSDIRLELTPGK